jgi:hypothetical protein
VFALVDADDQADRFQTETGELLKQPSAARD